MGAFLDKPKVDKQNLSGSGNGLRFGLSSMQGWRVEMEDAHSATIGLPKLKDWSFFAVFDGHAGARVSEYCARELLGAILNNQEFAESLSDSIAPPAKDDVQRYIRSGFLELDNRIREIPEMVSGEDKSGSTAVCVLISPNHIFFANCGDSRAVLSQNKKVAFVTNDHKPINPEEKDRIQKAGGSVMIQRVNGSLAVSRALGDFEYKNVEGKGQCEQLVSPEPEISAFERADSDEFLVLACDGIWDVMTNEELCDFVRDRMLLTNNLEEICNMVVDTCLYKGSRDNMSIVIVAFSGAPQVSEEARKKEKQLNETLETKVKEILESGAQEASMIPYIMHLLAVEELEGLPPGGGLVAKRGTIEEIVNRLSPSTKSELE